MNKSGAGAWTNSGTNTYTGATNVAAGTLAQSGGSITQTSSLTVDAATFQVTNDGNVNVLGGVINGAGTSNVFVDRGTMTVGNGFGAENVNVGLNGGTSTLTVTTGAVVIGAGNGTNFDIGRTTLTNTATTGNANFNGASSVTIDVDNLRLGTLPGAANPNSSAIGTLRMSATTNLITADTVTIGDSPGSGNTPPRASSPLAKLTPSTPPSWSSAARRAGARRASMRAAF